MKISSSIVLLMMVSIARPAASGATLLLNGEFTGSLDSWERIGTVFNTGDSAVLSDSAGPRAAVFQSTAVPDGTVSLRLSFDLLTALSPVAGLGQTPDSVFLSALLGTVAFGPSLETGAFDIAIPLLDADHRGPANMAAGLVTSPSPKGGGWIRYSLPLEVKPVATVVFEFLDGNGVAGDSVAAVDNVFLEAVLIPEPTIPVLMVFTLGFVSRRRRA